MYISQKGRKETVFINLQTKVTKYPYNDHVYHQLLPQVNTATAVTLDGLKVLLRKHDYAVVATKSNYIAAILATERCIDGISVFKEIGITSEGGVTLKVGKQKVDLEKHFGAKQFTTLAAVEALLIEYKKSHVCCGYQPNETDL